MMRRDSGFTALELMTAIAIAAVIAAIAMPPYLKWNRSRRLEGAANNLAADLEMAKMRAIRENAFVVVEFGAKSYTMFLDRGDGLGGPPNWSRDPDESRILNREMPAGVQIDTGSLSFPAFDNKARFNARGIPPDIIGPEAVQVASADKSRLITINRMGFITVQ
jgi:prepilin-type N-terminal cleavage/methylation domain-containing protein